jgi:hypothetical protein
MEEAGELAKAILPYEGACGTNHRLPNRDKIAEECADSMLVAYSIMKSMQLSDDEIVRMIQKKTDYWQFLQDNEHLAKLDDLIFEMHVTVDHIKDLETFKTDCAELGVKPIILDLFTDGETIKDMMTSSHYKGTTKGATEYSRDLVRRLTEKGYKVVREKIETVPWHPASKVAHLQNEKKYFEAHVAFSPLADEQCLNHFRRKFNVRFSANTMKKGDRSMQMGTLRRPSEVGIDQFTELLNTVISEMRMLFREEPMEKPVIEYALFDDNQKHDRKWIA